MWIRQIEKNILECESSLHTLNFLWQENNIYIMDNHLAAGWCWLDCLSQDKEYNFFHVDQHQDLCCGLATQDDLERIRNSYPFDIDIYCNFTFERGIATPTSPFNKVFTWNTYIKQLQYMFPHWFTECYFACPDYVHDNPQTTRLPLNIVYNATNLQIYNNISYWLSEKNERKWIFNLDFDYFFDNEGMQIYSDEYIKAFSQDLYKALENIAVLTIAMSPECCGNWENSIHILRIFSDIFHFENVIERFNEILEKKYPTP
ncbi:MAG: hypothetical protein J1F10_05470 [Muribaculaceae bacterium]|nr:hypothetical protein [Muribaculaceae bacterium]